VEITPQTKIDDLLTTYPELELFLMDLNPKYKKLKNPILRRTIAKIATLTQVAKIGGYEVNELVNLLRAEVGQEPLEGTVSESDKSQEQKATPKWIHNPPTKQLDATALLDQEKNPMQEVTAALKELKPEEHLLLTSDFLPAPLIEAFEKQGYEVYSEELNENSYRTYIKSKK
jgi:uncharacterized protein (DUF2249 family)